MKSNTIDINESTIRNFIESLRSKDPEIRAQLDYGYSYNKGIVLLYEIRPMWNNPKVKQQLEFAKIRFYKTRRTWNLYWMRGNGKWESYDPKPEANHLGKLLEIIKMDEYGCFFG